MASSTNQGTPINGQTGRSGTDFLPKYFRTETNQKFLGATVDQLISEGEVDKINAYIGRKNTSIYNSTDRYVEDVSIERSSYQLEPAIVIKDTLDNITFFKDYNDYINQIKFFNASTSDHSVLNSQEFYSWNPHVDWDKIVNFREYYWLPNGPQIISVAGQSTNITSTYSISLINDLDNFAYVFTPDGLTRNPSLRLYRGQTYRFEIDCPGQPIAFSTSRKYYPSQSLLIASDSGIEYGGAFDVKLYDSIAYDTGGFIYNTNVDITKTDPYNLYDIWTEGVTSQTVYVEKGVIEFTIPQDAPNILYYVSKNSINTGGLLKIYDITEATEIDVEKEIIGKKHYTMANGTALSNGMKVTFIGQVTPELYASGNWYVEGVGKHIQLINEKDLEVPAIFTSNELIEFDNELFDSQGYEVNNNFPATKDYITINRASKDRNIWSRYNRWFHKSVIETSSTLNNQLAVLDQNARAVRPIIEFDAGLQLVNYGKQAKQNVDLVDDFTKDVFSTIEGSLGYNVDGISLAPGMRVLFTADPDMLVNGRIFKVDRLTHLGISRITLVEEADTNPIDGETVLILQGEKHRGKMFHYKNNMWNTTQVKTKVNQSPLFDVFDIDGNSYTDSVMYPGSTFVGTLLFSYRPGTTYDSELNMNISYKNIENIGDIEFDFNLHTDSFTYQDNIVVNKITLDTSFLQINNGLVSTTISNGWSTSAFESKQPVVRQYEVSNDLIFFEIDVYDNSALITDLVTTVFVNGVKKSLYRDYEIYKQDNIAYIRFYSELAIGDSIIVESESSAKKNNNGFYKFPINLEHNPQNLSLTNFTLGEIIDHVKSIINNVTDFTGVLPGISNLRDIGDVSGYGTKVVQHSAPLTAVSYHLTNKKFNLIKALRYAKEQYGKFKRSIIRIATEYGYDGETNVHLDLVLREVVKEKTKNSPFYFSDMIPFGASSTFSQTVIDNAITDYPLMFDFNLETLSEKAVLVYLNGTLLLHRREYVFVNDNFVRIITPIVEGDELNIVQYSTTDGCFVPPTPSKLGLYPLYEPRIYFDTSYQTPTKVIQGHDGSITVAFNDYRDQLLLEFETRIYNNVKVSYDTSLIDINDYISGFYRTGKVSPDDLNRVMQQEFLKWTSYVSTDYTDYSFFDRNNPFTFNYSSFVDSNNTPLAGYWRGIFRYFYDTDRPNLAPWEMIGFSQQPLWWEEVYGPAPYTSDNLVLWRDLAEGIVREPNKLVVVRNKYKRPDLIMRIPVDSQGNLVPPINANLVQGYISTNTKKVFKFGDVAPSEAAWRTSHEYPFAVITALTLLRPAKLFSLFFDRTRQFRNLTGQIVYSTDRGHLRFNLADLIIPNTVNDSTRVFTSGLVNYMTDYITSLSTGLIAEYKNDISSLQVKLSSKLGGFTSQEKFKLVLDSRTPLNQGNVFIPLENYQIILNTSTPVMSISYSGVMVEKTEGGFIIKGYNQNIPQFNYFQPLVTASDPVVNVGGISQPFVDWDINKYYNKGSIVRYEQQYYRTIVGHSSSSIFEVKYFAKMSSLPIEGGRDIIVRRKFSTTVSTLYYGSLLETVQDVVDFMLGYGEYLTYVGFNFEYYNPTLQTVTDWQTAIREFAFWTTQKWAAGAVISVSPAADELKFQQPYCVVDNIYDDFYDYSVYRENGTAISPTYINGLRTSNNYVLRSTSTTDGIYHATLNLVQKEHVVVLDDTTIFNDVIYDQIQGYRQDRIKVLGYRTSNWQGDFNIPGFVYDRAVVKQWKQWNDYALGEAVKYKEFYYSAKKNVPGSENFDHSLWYKLDKRPVSKLIPNWDYRANQFPDFYDLETDSFDASQQKFAQHLIGYQRRDYLENIINDDVSQYKFYQGMIQEKGIKLSLTKLFDALNSADKDSLEFYEEWAIRIGQYGGTEIFDEVEYVLEESKFLTNPQAIELVDAIDPSVNDFVYRILPDETYLKSKQYNHSPIAVEPRAVEYIPTAGYVRPDDVQYIVKTKDEFTSYKIRTLRNGDYFWVGYDKNSWGVYRFSIFDRKINNVFIINDVLRITLVNRLDPDIKAGDYIGISNTIELLEGIYQVVSVDVYNFEIKLPAGFNSSNSVTINENPVLNLYKFARQRISSMDNLNELTYKRQDNELVWVDGVDNNWRVWKYLNTYQYKEVTAEGTTQFGSDIAVNAANTVLAVSATDKVLYFIRSSEFNKWDVQDQLKASATEIDVNHDYSLDKFGSTITLDPAGMNLFVSGIGYNNNSGYVVRFINDHSSHFILQGSIIVPPNASSDKQFGIKTAVYNTNLIIAAKDEIYVYDFTGTYKDSFQFIGELNDMAVSTDGTIAVSTNDKQVIILQVSSIDSTLSTPIYINTVDSVNSVAINKIGILAIGLPYYSNVNSVQGAVQLYKKQNNVYEIVQTISSPTNQESEQFGYSVKFNADGSQLITYSQGGNQDFSTTFDGFFNTLQNSYESDISSLQNDRYTTFDLEATNFVEVSKYVGIVRLFDKLENNYVYSNDLEVLDNLGSSFGSQIIATNRIYVNDPISAGGRVYDFASNNKVWTEYRKPEPQVKLERIKSVFLYDIEKNDIITHLDYIDPVKGKILGIAEQELSFKTHYDPAIYSVGIEDVVVDQLMGWQDKNVGRLWWDLSAVKFLNPYQGNVTYKANTWNSSFSGSNVDIYEWVKSYYKPSEWDELADTEEGLTAGISGKSKYGDLAFSYNQTYDTITKTFKYVYYFWVKNKQVVPDVSFRKISARDVSEYIVDPKSKGIRYITLLGSNQFALVNCKDLLSDRRIAINIRFWTSDTTDINVHSHYQLLAEGDASKKLNRYIEQKWFDSLIGSDSAGNEVPDPKLPPKLKYGVLIKPRQGMFINRIEALKQVVERVNSVLIKQLLIDNYSFEILNSKEEAPSYVTGRFDVEINSYTELRFVGTANIVTAQLTPVIEDGKLVRAIITNSGKGYGRLHPKKYNILGEPIQWQGPTVKVNGLGHGASVSTIINDKGEIISVNVERSGEEYATVGTSLLVRPFTVLITEDETAIGKWTLNSFDANKNTWARARIQTFNTPNYWTYVDWFQEGYNQFTPLHHAVDFAYEIPLRNIEIGEIVRVNYEGAGGWLLLEKIDNQDTTEVTVNYKVIGRQNGTIQFKTNLYMYSANNIGYDGLNFDTGFYDNQPKNELRIILNCIKENLLVNELAVEYNKLFFASLRYVMTEQLFIDWAFKTSFVKSVHNLGALKQVSTFQPATLSNYESYINEVKPYRTKVREFVSNFDRLENTRSSVVDFDLIPRYNYDYKTIVPYQVKVIDGRIAVDSEEVFKEPNLSWYVNAGHQVTDIKITNAGSGYKYAPVVEFSGACAEPATAKAYLSRGSVSKIVITNPGKGYVETPIITLNGSVLSGGIEATAIAISGNSLVRSFNIGLKFDRISPKYQVNNLNVIQHFVGTGSKSKFQLTWPVDIRSTSTIVTVNNEEKLFTEYTVYNELDTSVSYTRYKGIIEFNSPAITVPVNSAIVVSYKKDISLLDAADRIQHYYSPSAGQLGKELGQLMTGVDYGGVEVTGLKFDIGAGWDALPWYSDTWDSFDNVYTDYLVKSDQTTRTFTLPYVPNTNEIITVYVNNVRIDDVHYDVHQSLITAYNDAVANLNTLTTQLPALTATYNTAQSDLVAAATTLYNAQQTLSLKNAQLLALIPNTPAYNSKLAEVMAAQTAVNNAQDAYTNKLVVRNTAQSALSLKQHQIDTATALVETTLNEKTLFEQNLPTMNKNAIMNSFVGNNRDKVIVIPDTPLFVQNNVVIFRKDTSDGSFMPADTSYDVEVVGGDFLYTTATGLNPADIIVDGDGFVTENTSHAPEEVVPGQVTDAVNIGVYYKVAGGVPVIDTQHYVVVNSNNKTYAIGQTPGNIDSIFVTVNHVSKVRDVDYLVNFEDNTIEILHNLSVNDQISITSITQSGVDILDAKTVIATQGMSEYITSAISEATYSSFITVNGVTVNTYVFVTDDTYEEPNYIGIRFETPLNQGDIVNYMLVSSSVESVSRAVKETIVYNGSSSYSLLTYPGIDSPFEPNVIVQVNGTILRSPDFEYFDVSGTSRTYSISTIKYANNSIESDQIDVYVNGRMLYISADYSWTSASNELRIKRGVAKTGDKVVVEIRKNAQYTLHDNVITFLDQYDNGQLIYITTFFNHNILQIERSNEYIRTESELVANTPEYYTYNHMTNGRFKLRRNVYNANYVWITLNGNMLTPNVDFIIEDNYEYIQLDSSIRLTETDIIDIIAFGNNIITGSYGYRIFKDMLNRTTYKRVAVETQLANELKYYDLTITVADGSQLATPSTVKNIPGVVFINKERIEYFKKQGNVLSQLRRGTLGTGVKSVYRAGTKVLDQSVQHQIPYKDEVISTVVLVDETTTHLIPLTYTPKLDESTVDIHNTWYRSTIPAEYGQCNDIEVFVGGRRLRKAPVTIWDVTVGPDSPTGDIQLEAEFSVDGITDQIRLTKLPEVGTQIRIQKKLGKMWNPSDTSLIDANTVQANFIRAKTSN